MTKIRGLSLLAASSASSEGPGSSIASSDERMLALVVYIGKHFRQPCDRIEAGSRTRPTDKRGGLRIGVGCVVNVGG